MDTRKCGPNLDRPSGLAPNVSHLLVVTVLGLWLGLEPTIACGYFQQLFTIFLIPRLAVIVGAELKCSVGRIDSQIKVRY